MTLLPERFTLRPVLTAVSILLACVVSGCTADMATQPRYEPVEASELSPEGESSPVLLVEVVPRNAYGQADPLYAGLENNIAVATIPVLLTGELLAQRQEQYTIFCAPCHGSAAYENGLIGQLDFPQLPSFHTEEKEMRQASDGHYRGQAGGGHDCAGAGTAVCP